MFNLIVLGSLRHLRAGVLEISWVAASLSDHRGFASGGLPDIELYPSCCFFSPWSQLIDCLQSIPVSLDTACHSGPQRTWSGFVVAPCKFGCDHCDCVILRTRARNDRPSRTTAVCLKRLAHVVWVAPDRKLCRWSRQAS